MIDVYKRQVLGLAFGYFFVSPAILEVLMRLGEGLFDTQLTAQNYLTFLWHTTLPLGVLFELPVLVAFLTSIGLLTPQFLITYRDVYKRQITMKLVSRSSTIKTLVKSLELKWYHVIAPSQWLSTCSHLRFKNT